MAKSPKLTGSVRAPRDPAAGGVEVEVLEVVPVVVNEDRFLDSANRWYKAAI